MNALEIVWILLENSYRVRYTYNTVKILYALDGTQLYLCSAHYVI
jgi:hypothetical protein